MDVHVSCKHGAWQRKNTGEVQRWFRVAVTMTFVSCNPRITPVLIASREKGP